MILLAAFAAAPLYLSQAVSPLIVLAFHFGLAVAAAATASNRTLRRITAVVRIGAIFYLPLYILDATVLTSLIRASVHLLFFIAFYQAIDEKAREARNQRLLVAFLLFVTSLATSTHQTILLFVGAFTVVMFVRLIRASDEDSAAALGELPQGRPALRAAFAFAVPTALIAALLFPALPRIQNPMVRGIRTGLDSAATGISDTIDFRGDRRISNDPMAVARVWMPRDAVPFFTPLRLRATVYDAWRDGEWVQTLRRTGEMIDASDGHIALARPAAFSRGASVEQKTLGGKLLLPEGTFDVAGFDHLYVIEPYGTAYHPGWIGGERVRGEVRFDVVMSREIRPLLARPAPIVDYPVTPEIRALAMQIARNAQTDREKAAVIASHLETSYTYIPDPAELGRAYTVEEFLLSVRRGHCEYFAAGMVVLLTALDVPARIVGGYYGGELNPLIGSFIVRHRDAHAWVEVHDGKTWRMYDPTPVPLRPGAESRNLLIAYVRALTDSVAYFWDRYILTFGSADQVALLAQAFYAGRDAWDQVRQNMRLAATEARANAGRLAVLLLLSAAALVAVFLLARRRSAYERLLRILADHGVESSDATAPGEMLERVRARRPDLAPLVEPVIEAYVRDRFAPRRAPDDLRAAASKALRALRAQ